MPGAPIIIDESGYDPSNEGVYENTPAPPPDGVIRSVDPNPSVEISAGTAKSLTEKYSSSDARAEGESLSLTTLQKGMASAMVMQWKEDHPGISMDGVISGATGGTNQYSERLIDCGIDKVLFEQWKYMNFKTMLRNTGGNFLDELLEEMGVSDAPGRLDKSSIFAKWEAGDDRGANIFGRTIKLNEDEGFISENNPITLDGVCRESEYKADTEVVEKGLTHKIKGKWVSGDLGQIKTKKKKVPTATLR